MESLNIAYYITGHGYGHATRSIEIIRQFAIGSNLSRPRHVHIVSKLEATFFDISLTDIPRGSYTVHSRCLDAGAIQSNALAVDMHATLELYRVSIFPNHDELVQHEIQFLKDHNIQIVLCDATPLGCLAAKLAGVKSFIVSNFTWDFIYKDMVSRLSLAAENGSNFGNLYADSIAQCANDYNSADNYILLPGSTPTSSLAAAPKLIPGPLVSRCSQLSKSEVLEKYQLNIPPSTHIVAVTFGGHDGSGSSPLSTSSLPEGWHCIVLGGGWSLAKAVDNTRFHFLPRETFVPDIVNAVDVVIGKIGYGTVSECLTSYPESTPLVFVPRTGWPEEQYLIDLIVSYRCAVSMSESLFACGNWKDSILTAAALSPAALPAPSGVDAARSLVEIILS